MEPIRWSHEELTVRLATATLDLEVGVAHDRPVLVVDGPDGGGRDLAPLTRESLAGLAAVTMRVGEAPSAGDDAFDVVATEAEVDHLVGGVLAHPRASLVLTQVLRAVEDLPVERGLEVESIAYALLQAGPEHASWLAARGRRVRRPDPRPRIVVGVRDTVRTIVLDRPRLHNALDATMRDQLVDALRAACADPGVTRVELSGNGPSFSIGGDLAEFGTTGDPVEAHVIRTSANVAPWLHRIADRLVVDVHGTCVGAGVELAAFAGTVRAAPDTTFALPEVSMGLIPGAGGTVSVSRRIGRRRTAAWVLGGQTIDAGQALQWGLIDEVVEGIGPVGA